MEVIQSVFDQLQNDFTEKLKVLEKQVVFILSANLKGASSSSSEDLLAIKRSLDSFSARMTAMENRLSLVERKPAPHSSPAAVASAGLEGLLMKPIALPSPALTALSENQVVVPTFQRQIILNEESEEAEPDEEVLEAAVAEETGGIDAEEEAAEEEQEQEEEEEEEVVVEEEQEQEEEEEGETIELEEFPWKGKTYFKTPDNLVYRANEDGDVEDEPFARYDPTTKPPSLKRI